MKRIPNTCAKCGTPVDMPKAKLCAFCERAQDELDDLRQQAAEILQTAAPYSELELDIIRQAVEGIEALSESNRDTTTEKKANREPEHS